MKNWLLAHSGRFGRAAMTLGNDKRGVTALEYALIAGAIVTTVVVGFNTMAQAIDTKFTTIATSLG